MKPLRYGDTPNGFIYKTPPTLKYEYEIKKTCYFFVLPNLVTSNKLKCEKCDFLWILFHQLAGWKPHPQLVIFSCLAHPICRSWFSIRDSLSIGQKKGWMAEKNLYQGGGGFREV